MGRRSYVKRAVWSILLRTIKLKPSHSQQEFSVERRRPFLSRHLCFASSLRRAHFGINQKREEEGEEEFLHALMAINMMNFYGPGRIRARLLLAHPSAAYA